MPPDEMIADVDRYIKGLRFGSEVLDLVSLDDKAFQVKMEELDAYFDTLKQEIDLVLQVGYENTNIIQKSETFFLYVMWPQGNICTKNRNTLRII